MARDEVVAEGPPRAYGTIVIVGGGCYGAYYEQQLRRARAREAIAFQHVVIVDRDPECRMAHETAAESDLRVSDWRAFFRQWLDGEARAGDAIVPSPLMPHLLFDWLEERARMLWPARTVEMRTPAPIAGIPWQRVGRDGTRFVSFAEWTCPVNCIEPRMCPHTRATRSWSLPPALLAHLSEARDSEMPLDGPVIFHCAHRAYGVGMIDVADVLGAARTLVHNAAEGPTNLLVGTVSHCHGALGVLAVG